MAQETRTQLKTYFQTGDIPTQAQFENLIDSCTSLETTIDSTGGTMSPDFSATTSIYTLLQDVSIIIGAPVGLTDGSPYSFIIEQDGAGGSEVTFHSAYKFPMGYTFSMPTNVGEIAIVEGYAHNGILYLKEASYYG